jgi:CheY-like chemotaxis protein
MDTDPIPVRRGAPLPVDPGMVAAPRVVAAPWVVAVPASRRRLALIVDDEAMVGNLMAMALDSRGWETVVATAGSHAAVIAQEREPDLLLTDLQMPGMSGIDLAASLRAWRGDLPVLLMSGSSEAAALTLPQPFAFLAKPFSLAALFSTVGRLVPASPPES